MSNALSWPTSLKGLLPTSFTFSAALTVSLLVHASVLAVHFKLPDALDKASEHALDVILVNSKSQHRPTNVQAKAQANLDGGGNTDEKRIAATPLPVSPTTNEGTDLVEAQRRVTQLEAQTRQMLTQTKSDRSVAVDRAHAEPAPPTPPAASGFDLADRAMAMIQLEGKIAREQDAYSKRPRKKFIGARVEEARYAQYVEDWRQKVQRIGNLNYPESARGRLYGSLVLTVVIRSDGSLDHVEVNRPSGIKVLDDAAKRIVEMAAPFGAFPASIRRDTDILEITRTWTFTTADRLQSN
jgi:periplasmic protein TonB